MEGLVVRTESGFHRVRADEEIYVCRAPKRLLIGQRTATTAVVIGDHVLFRPMKGGTGIIQEILPRANELIRGSAGGRYFLDVIAANLDQIVVVDSIKHPEFNAARVDRFLLMAEAAEIPAILCVNKVDLAEPAEVIRPAGRYRSIGYPVLITSVRTGEGVDALRGVLTDKISAVVGPSGAGKSSLLNCVQPGLRLRTGEVSEATGKGRHTTSTAELLTLNAGGYVADTPGLRELGIREVDPQDLQWLFPDFKPYLGQCRFSDCTHREEVDCAVRAAVERGAIWPERYRSYRRVYGDLLERRAY